MLALTTAGVACTRTKSKHTDVSSEVSEDVRDSRQPQMELLEFDLALGRPWKTRDPFLFCVHHNDKYPRGNDAFGPAQDLSGRELGRDFDFKDGFNMYHGRTVPGFPAHPHRGFETVTVVRRGRLDHADSLGAAARYGDGDVQWLTAGRGIQHSEMFPLLRKDDENPLDLFQIWLNLPARRKMVAPYFKMLWAESIPEKRFTDEAGRRTIVTVRAGVLGGISAPAPPPDSWASDPSNEVGIFTVALEPGAKWQLPGTQAAVLRSVYFFEGTTLNIAGRPLDVQKGVELDGAGPIAIENTGRAAEVLILQGKPIAEPVFQSGPFVMNSQAEIRQAYQDYRSTRFGGWPWEGHAPVHGPDPARFARLVDGKTERPG